MSEVELDIYIVYFNTSDFPGEYVVRRQVMTKDGSIYAAGDLLCRGETLDFVRSYIPRDRVYLPRDPNDDPVIVEMYL